jgi:phosphoglycolate phosphatase
VATAREPPPRVALIDLHGTLMYTAPDLALAANRVRGEFGLADRDVERVSQFVGKGTGLPVHRALTDDIHGRVDEESLRRTKAAFERRYRDVNDSPSLVLERVSKAPLLLREAGLRRVCVTSTPREFPLALPEGDPLLPQLDALVAGNELARRKPHPDGILEACSRLQTGLGEAIRIRDSANDGQEAYAAACPVVAVETGCNEGDSVHGPAGKPGVGGIFLSLYDAARWVTESFLSPVPAPDVTGSTPRSALP